MLVVRSLHAEATFLARRDVNADLVVETQCTSQRALGPSPSLNCAKIRTGNLHYRLQGVPACSAPTLPLETVARHVACRSNRNLK
jgi:hypothetical protein